MLLGDRLVGKDYLSSPTATYKDDNQKTSHAPTSLHKVHHTCMLRDSQTLTQEFLKLTITH